MRPRSTLCFAEKLVRIDYAFSPSLAVSSLKRKLDKKHLKVKEDAEDVDIDALMRKWMAPHIGEKWDTVGD